MKNSTNQIITGQLDIFKEDMKFSVAHFTIFDKKKRENIHGHNFEVEFTVEFKTKKNGMFRNYRELKTILRRICSSLDEHLIIPGNNQFIEIKKNKDSTTVRFANESLVFLNRDIKILPIENTTVEDFSEWILLEIIKDKKLIDPSSVSCLKVEVRSSKGQSGTSILNCSNN